ncbi:MAG TPA: TM2 domain-containing protein [Candidatus Binataceae bacterium]|nr:TM2 domain-containing protein [Candidatus Binataceae bacterium]
MYCPQCGYANRYDARYCASCSVPMPLDEPVAAAMRSPGVAAVLSFFWCGLGQIYNGQIGKGIVMLLLYGISWAMMWLIIGLITTPLLWVWGMWDAYRTAERLNRQRAGGLP